MSLLPKHHDEFKSKEYWDHFFTTRGEAFEWLVFIIIIIILFLLVILF